MGVAFWHKAGLEAWSWRPGSAVGHAPSPEGGGTGRKWGGVTPPPELQCVCGMAITDTPDPVYSGAIAIATDAGRAGDGPGAPNQLRPLVPSPWVPLGS